jgi:hypothetical protein
MAAASASREREQYFNFGYNAAYQEVRYKFGDLYSTIRNIQVMVGDYKENQRSSLLVEIMQKLDDLRTDINVRPRSTSTNEYFDLNGNTIYKSSGKEINIENLDSNSSAVLGTEPHNLVDIDFGANVEVPVDDRNINTIQNRLINCQYLEILYLAKHDELIKIFQFVVSLFDKYKYAIRVILWIISNLNKVEPRPEEPRPEPEPEPRPPTPGTNSRPDGCPPCPKIRLPVPLIRNINELLKDQKKIQETIGLMKNTINEQHEKLPHNFN